MRKGEKGLQPNIKHVVEGRVSNRHNYEVDLDLYCIYCTYYEWKSVVKLGIECTHNAFAIITIMLGIHINM